MPRKLLKGNGNKLERLDSQYFSGRSSSLVQAAVDGRAVQDAVQSIYTEREAKRQLAERIACLEGQASSDREAEFERLLSQVAFPRTHNPHTQEYNRSWCFMVGVHEPQTTAPPLSSMLASNHGKSLDCHPCWTGSRN